MGQIELKIVYGVWAKVSLFETSHLSILQNDETQLGSQLFLNVWNANHMVSVPSSPEYTIESMLTEQSHTRQEFRSTLDQQSDTASHRSPHRGSSNLPNTIITTRMAFSYPRFSGDTDVEGHIQLFLNVWNANHMVQQHPKAEVHALKIAEFGLTLDGRAARWHSQLDITLFASFDQLQSSFLRFFHRSIPQREIIGQFYTIKQLQQESVVDFNLRFQSLRR